MIKKSLIFCFVFMKKKIRDAIINLFLPDKRNGKGKDIFLMGCSVNAGLLLNGSIPGLMHLKLF